MTQEITTVADELTIPLRQAALRVINAEVAARTLKVTHLRKQMGNRIPKALNAEATQMETEIAGLTIVAARLAAEG